jgi:hypothetical protein
MDGRHIESFYTNIPEQGGGWSVGGRSKEGDVYIPKDSSHKTQTDLSKLFKENRLLQKELNETKAELKKTKQLLDKATKNKT